MRGQLFPKTSIAVALAANTQRPPLLDGLSRVTVQALRSTRLSRRLRMDGFSEVNSAKILFVSLCVPLGTASVVHSRHQHVNSQDRWVICYRSIVGLFSILLTGAILAFTGGAYAQNIDWEKVDATLGHKALVSSDVHRYGFPRSDLTVMLDGVTLKPALALGGWVGFKPMGGEAMVMGDLVLLETEINPVMTKLIESGIEVTAIHNHLLRAKPTPLYMHVGGHGDPIKLATALRAALAESKTPLEAPAAAAAPEVELDRRQLDEIVGVMGDLCKGWRIAGIVSGLSSLSFGDDWSYPA
jgi:Domain of Unknown Function (DUF1259)